MNSILLEHGLISQVQSWMWPFFRITGMMMTAPVIGTRSVPKRVRLIIAIALTIVIVPVISMPKFVEPLSFEGLIVTTQQLLIGISMGLTIRVVFVVLELAGQLIGQLIT